MSQQDAAAITVAIEVAIAGLGQTPLNFFKGCPNERGRPKPNRVIQTYARASREPGDTRHR